MANRIQRSDQRSPMRRTMVRYGEYLYEHTDLSKKPEDKDYGWKRVSLLGEEDKQNMVIMDHNGWEPVPADRHPELAGRKATAGQQIVLGGLMLCEIDKQDAEYAEQEMKDRAVMQVANQARKLKIENQIGARMSFKHSASSATEQYGDLE